VTSDVSRKRFYQSGMSVTPSIAEINNIMLIRSMQLIKMINLTGTDSMKKMAMLSQKVIKISRILILNFVCLAHGWKAGTVALQQTIQPHYMGDIDIE